MTVVTKEEVKRVADLAHLAITDEEAASYTEHLAGIIRLADELKELNTEGIAPMTHGLERINIMRDDVPNDILDREEMLKSVKEQKDGQIKVPTIL